MVTLHRNQIRFWGRTAGIAMWVDVSLLVTLLGDDGVRRPEFTRAMRRRGWNHSPDFPDTYRVSFSEPGTDEEVVQICTRDVQNSAYVAGVSQFQATCLIANDSIAGCDTDSDDDAYRSTRFDCDDASPA
jgi:hypothetical protein